MTDGPPGAQCRRCDSRDIECADSTGGVVDGRFTEKYLCNDCGATGSISGRAEEPAKEWRARGDLFGDS